MQLKDKTILITGGTAGIGLEAVKQFLEAGSKVIVTGRNQTKLDEVTKKYPSVIAIQSDASNPNDAIALYNEVKKLGGIDILYNNAGVISEADNLGNANPKHFEKAEAEININYLGVIRLNNIFMDMLKSRTEGAIINTSSLLSYLPSNLAPTYSASKAAVRFYTVALRDHLQITGSKLKVFELLPPLVATKMADGMGGKAMTTDKLINALIDGLKKNQYTIRVGDTKTIYFLNRFFPKLAYNLINSKASSKKLQS